MPSHPTYPIKITLAKHDLYAPVFVAGSFTHPPWHPHIMEHVLPHQHVKDHDLREVFTKEFDIPEGRHQYKFKIGHGNWWICDETAESADDGHGNINNILIVGPDGPTTEIEPEDHISYKKPTGPTTALDRAHKDDSYHEEESYEDAPLMPHEKPSLTTEGGLEVDPGYKGRRTSLGMKIGRVHTFVPPEPTKEDLKDPGLEKFPVKKSGILNRMHTLKHQLPIDDSSHLDNDGEDMMQYQLTRSLAHLASNEKPKFSPTFMELTQPKREASTEGLLDGTVEIEPTPITMPEQSSTSALLHKSSSTPECYGTLRYLIAGADGNTSPPDAAFQRVRPTKAKYVSSAATTARSSSTDANNASTDDQQSDGESTPLMDGSSGRTHTVVADGRKSWIDRTAAGVAFASVCIVLGGGLVYVSSRARS